MIDIKLIRENKELVKENIKKKFQDHKLPLVDEIYDLDIKFRDVKQEGDNLRSLKNTKSSEIGSLMREGKTDEANKIKEEIASMSDEEIFARVYEAINISDHLMQATSPVLVKNNHAIEGLENVLYVCPKCKCKNTYVSHGLEMKCNKCGNTIVMDSHARIHAKTSDDVCFPNESRWYEWQSELIKEAFLKDDFILENNVLSHVSIRISSINSSITFTFFIVLPRHFKFMASVIMWQFYSIK